MRPAIWATLACLATGASLSANNHGAAPVPPTLEIAVLDPNADPLGNPAVRTRPGLAGGLEVDIPQTVLVHRYYYSGDRSFQAQLLPGGPCIVVVHHPKNGERLYIPVQMIPGAPRVHYTHRAIDYDYGHQGIRIEFALLTGRPRVEYRSGKTVRRVVEETSATAKATATGVIERIGLGDLGRWTASKAKSLGGAAMDRVHDAGQTVAGPLQGVGQALPGASLLQSTSEDAAQRLRDADVRRAAEKALPRKIDIPTIR